MENRTSPLSDLSFFRFPELTADKVQNITVLVVLLILTVVLTVLVQRLLARYLERGRRRASFGKLSSGQHMPPSRRAVLEQLRESSGFKDAFDLVHDAEAFEGAVAAWAPGAREAQLKELAVLRRSLNLHVMNAELALVSTRQLLADLPLRLLAEIGPEKLDLYCAPLRVDERNLYFDMHGDEDIHALLVQNPDVLLVFWREQDGETVFHLTLDPVPGEGPALFRAAHALYDPEAAQRADFRLTLDTAAEYRLVAKRRLGLSPEPEISRATARKGASAGTAEAAEAAVAAGSGRMVDISHGGASLLLPEPPEPGGYAEIGFALNQHPQRAMIEVLSATPAEQGRYLVRGRFRGMGEEARGQLARAMTSEQLRRLRQRRRIHIRPAG